MSTNLTGNASRPGGRPGRAPRRGSIAVLTLILIAVLLAMAAFAVDVSYMQLTRSQLRRTTDLAARAAGEAIYRTGDTGIALAAARRAARENPVAGRAVALDARQVVFGNASVDHKGKWSFNPGNQPYNSVQIRNSLTSGSANGSVSLFFGRFMGTGAFEPEAQATVARGEGRRDFAVVVDRSGSMNGNATGGNGDTRWEVLKRSIQGFFDALDETNDEEEVGLATYSNRSTENQQLEFDYSETRDILEGIHPSGSTNIHAGIVDGADILGNRARGRDDARKLMIVMTDGLHNTGPEPILAARDAKAAGIIIYTITFGHNADISRMKAIADETGGAHYHAPNAAELEDVFRRVVVDSAEMVFIQ